MRIEAATATTATTSDEDDANDDGDGDERRRHGYDTTTRTEHCHPSRAEAGYDDDAATTRRDDDVTATTMRHDDDDATTSRACPSQSLQPQVPLTVAAPPGAPHSRCLVAASLAQPLQPPQQASLLLFTANARGWRVRTAVEAQRRRGDDDTTTNTRRRPRGDNDRAPISATEMLPPNRADAGTRRRGDDEAATRRRRRQPRCRCSPQAHSRCSPHAHSRCSAQAVTEASGAATAPASLLPQAFRCPHSPCSRPPSRASLLP